MKDTEDTGLTMSDQVAIVGMACRLPGADTLDGFWEIIREGRDTITRRPEQAKPGFQPVRGLVSDKYGFDAKLFGMQGKEARFLNPQHRLLLEASHDAFENAAIDPHRHTGRISVYTSSSQNDYHQQLLKVGLSPVEKSLAYSSNYAEYAASRISYLLNLRGESLSVQTACSSSLVAVHLAAKSLASGQSDVALVGGVNVGTDAEFGYKYQEGLHFSPTGHCRPFDHRANGMVASDGVAVVVLKRLAEAVSDGDPIWAIIRGSAINNDGRDKMSYTAPSVAGHARAIRAAWSAAQIDTAKASYLEAHGTGTLLGDPIEIAAFADVFAPSTKDPVCIGSVKGNIGHTVHAAGVAGLIKLAMVLKHRIRPPCANLEAVNPEIDLMDGAFSFPSSPSAWQPHEDLVAGLSSLGFGGTNAHAVVSQAPTMPPQTTRAGPVVLPLSARTASALAKSRSRLADGLTANARDLTLQAAAATLQDGRTEYALRDVVVAETLEDASRLLREAPEPSLQTPAWSDPVLLVTGQSPGLAPEENTLAAVLPTYASLCAAARNALGLRAQNGTSENAANAFVKAYADFALWRALGIRPAQTIGLDGTRRLAAALHDQRDPASCADAYMADLQSAPSRTEPASALFAAGDAPPTLQNAGHIGSVLDVCADHGAEVIEIGAGPYAVHLLGLFACADDMPRVVRGIATYRDLLVDIGRMWQRGAKINWTELNQGRGIQRVHLPGYPYERQPFRIEQSSAPVAAPPAPAPRSIKQPDVAAWFHEIRWHPIRPGLPHESVAEPSAGSATCYVLIGPDCDLQRGLANRIAATTGAQIVTATHAESFADIGGGSFAVPYDDRESCRALFNTLADQGVTHLRVLCLATIADDGSTAVSLQVPLAICGALQKCGLPADLLFLTRDAADLAPDDRLRPSSTMVAGLARCIGQECRTIKASSLDIGHAVQDDLIDHVLDELGAAGDQPEVALRGRTRWVPMLVPSETAALAVPVRYGTGDVHVIFGGTGHVGLALAREIAGNGPAQRILLVSRTAATNFARDVQQTIVDLNRSGACVSAHSVDLTDLTAVLALLRDAASKTGQIAQVIHAAGVVDPRHLKFITETSYQSALETVSPHVAGAETLADAVSQVAVERVVLCSSLSSSVGGLSYGAHAAGHRYLDAVAARETAQERSQAQWIVIDYDTWRVPSRAANIGAGGQDWAIEPDEGFAVLALACAMGTGRYAVSTPALSDRPGYRAPVDSDHRPAGQVREPAPSQRTDAPVPDGDTIADLVTACFEEVLEIEDIDPEQSFFDLGGESLLFLDVLDLLKERTGIDVPQSHAFEAMSASDMITLCERLNREKTSETAEPQA